ncbi:MAG: hypothetical protein Q4P78_09000 [Rothia sp. (in: high G+C Gram-positive bacteria)]|uniref:hypothetical protein n=1 Tax=Rothia sp. (in: high G+C Gram-positive bacteria) TaxID=1885016 RepID=UPI0026DECC63|nr:hypothetical protein [Rothia sp. (in: high G+C Gram-positive bacteria)]MDO5751312.1 hypothetical protein [Rothia sp. (in: high G+C Gram-positive bacteria)]
MQFTHNNMPDPVAFKHLLLSRKTTKARFRLPLSYEQTVTYLTAAVEAEVEYRHQAFVASDALTQHIATAAHWLGGKGKFGLMLMGRPGNGKTTLMRAIASLINAFDMLRDDYGDPMGVRTMAATELARLNRDDYHAFRKVCFTPMLALDDLGQEPNEIKDYGNIVTPAVDLLCQRYNDQLFTLVTTNLAKRGAGSLREYYGDRIADRFNEMMDFIVFDEPSYRGR